jgi:hypothetical protein
MEDEAYARELFAILTRPLDPDEPVDSYGTGSDRIDRHGGFGTEVKVTSIDVVPGPYGAQIEIGFALEVPDGVDVPAEGSFLLPVDREWREAQGCVTPALYAPLIATQTERAAGRHVDRHTAARTDAVVQDPDDLAALVREVEEQHPGTTFVATADEWAQVLRRHHGRRARLFEDVAELVASSHRDEHFLVFWEGELVRSVRATLPPVSGGLKALLGMQAARDRGEDPYAGGAWYAYTPVGDEQ